MLLVVSMLFGCMVGLLISCSRVMLGCVLFSFLCRYFRLVILNDWIFIGVVCVYVCVVSVVSSVFFIGRLRCWK